MKKKILNIKSKKETNTQNIMPHSNSNRNTLNIPITNANIIYRRGLESSVSFIVFSKRLIWSWGGKSSSSSGKSPSLSSPLKTDLGSPSENSVRQGNAGTQANVNTQANADNQANANSQGNADNQGNGDRWNSISDLVRTSSGNKTTKKEVMAKYPQGIEVNENESDEESNEVVKEKEKEKDKSTAKRDRSETPEAGPSKRPKQDSSDVTADTDMPDYGWEGGGD